MSIDLRQNHCPASEGPHEADPATVFDMGAGWTDSNNEYHQVTIYVADCRYCGSLIRILERPK
jgi:hypothetical protein